MIMNKILIEEVKRNLILMGVPTKIIDEKISLTNKSIINESVLPRVTQFIRDILNEPGIVKNIANNDIFITLFHI